MLTRSICSAVIVTALATGCAPPEDDVDAYRDAVPDEDALAIRVPGAEARGGAGDAVGQSQQALIGDTADLYLFTRDVSREVNATAYFWLHVVDDITDLPPTSFVEGKAVWGPHTPALSLITYVFVVEKDGDTYRYALEGKVKNQSDDAYLPLLSGENTPGPASRHDEGFLTMHIDNARALDPTHVEDGKVRFEYATAGANWDLDVTFDDFVNEDGEGPVDALYHYRELADESGDFAFAAYSDVQDDGSLPELWNVRSRWMSGGSGRSDVDIVGGDLGAVHVSATECWNEMFERTYWHVDPDVMDPEEGDPNACVFAPSSP